MTYAEPMALGVIGLSPQEFEGMTPSEFINAVKGYYWLREREQKTNAHNLVSIINTCGNLKKGKRVREKDFYRPSNIDPRNPFYRGLLGI